MAETQTEKSELITGLETAVSASPDNVELRLLLTGHLLEAGHHRDALTHATAVVQAHPDRIEAYRFAAQAARATGDPRAAAYEKVGRALAAVDGAPKEAPRPAVTSAPTAPHAAPVVTASSRPPHTEAARPDAAQARASVVPDDAPDAPPRRRTRHAAPAASAAAPARPETVVSEASPDEAVTDDAVVETPAPKRGRRVRGGALKRRQEVPAEVEAEAIAEPDDAPEIDLDALVPDEVTVTVDAETDADGVADPVDDEEVWETPAERFVIAPEDIEQPRLTLASIATDTVRDRFEAVVVNPLRHGGGARKSAQGGMLLFGPDGCGKGFFARIVAGELKARFLRVDMAEAMQWPGDPRENIGVIFEAARSTLPCVLYLDNIDRAGTHPDTPEDAADRRLLSRLASEITGAASSRGLVVFGGTTAPWDVDMTLLSNGRLDRSLVVLPPDGPARETILRDALSDAPLSGVDLPWIIERTRHFSVDDLVSLADRAKALAAINALGDQIVVGPGEMTRAFREVRPAAPAWFSQIHDNAVGGGNQEGMYDEVRSYMSSNQLV